MLTNQCSKRTCRQIPILQNVQQVEIEDRGSVVIDNDDNEISDSAHYGGSNGDSFEVFTRNGMFKVEERSREYNIIARIFHGGVERQGNDTNILAVHRNTVFSLVRKAWWLSFRLFSQAVAEKCGGNANVRSGWYGASREEICQVISRGFSLLGETANGDSHGIGISLSAAKFSSNGVASTIVDENGVRHMLLCRVILGKMELIPAGSKQFRPSSAEFDSGADNLEEPTKFTVWSASMNSHIFPIYIISIKAPYLNSLRSNLVRPVGASLPWMSFNVLLNLLKMYLEPSKMAMIFKLQDDFKVNILDHSHRIPLDKLSEAHNEHSHNSAMTIIQEPNFAANPQAEAPLDLHKFLPLKILVLIKDGAPSLEHKQGSSIKDPAS